MVAHALRGVLRRLVAVGLLVVAAVVLVAPLAHADTQVEPPPGPGGQEGEAPWYTYGRLELSPYVAGWLYSGELNMDPSLALGLRVAPVLLVGWEVPGQLRIHLDVAWSHADTERDGNNEPDFTGNVINYGIYIGLQNPELSITKEKDGVERYIFTTTAGIGLDLFSQVGFHRGSGDVFTATTPPRQVHGSLPNITRAAFTPWVEWDLHFSEYVRLGFSLRVHLIFASDLQGDGKNFFQHDAAVFEPAINLSIFF